MINVVLVDDISYCLEEIEKEVQDFFTSSGYAYKIYKFFEYDENFFELVRKNLENMICLFDIETVQENGIDIARKVRKYNQDLDILFLTVHNTNTYKNRIVVSNIKSMGFIYKANLKTELPVKLNEFLTNVQSKENFHFHDGLNQYSLSFKDIYYVTTDKVKSKTVLKTTSCDILLSLTLQEVEQILLRESPFFIRIHRSYIVNVQQIMILNIPKKLIVFSNQDSIHSISRNYKKDLEKAWEKYHHPSDKAFIKS